MLAMTRKILQWLQDNEAQLQDIDYADGVDHGDVQTLVYRRPDAPEVPAAAMPSTASSQQLTALDLETAGVWARLGVRRWWEY